MYETNHYISMKRKNKNSKTSNKLRRYPHKTFSTANLIPSLSIILAQCKVNM